MSARNNAHKNAGYTPWFDRLFDFCEDHGGCVELALYGQKSDLQGRLVRRGTFVLTAQFDGRPPKRVEAGELERAANLICQELGIRMAA